MDKNKILNIVKKVIIHTVGLGCVLGAVWAAFFFIKYSFVDTATTKSDRYYINDVYDQPIVQLFDGETFSQDFEAHGDIFGVQIRWHNLGEVQRGTALLELVDGETGDVLTATTYNLNVIVNDVYNEIAFDEPYYNDEEGYQPYTLRITPTFNEPESSYLKIWGDSQSKTIAFGVLEYMVNPDNVYGWFSLLKKITFIAVIVIYAACFIFKFKKETVYLICLLAASCLFTLALPPYSSPDEEGHFNSAYKLVNQWDGMLDSESAGGTIYKRADDKNKVLEEKYTTVLNYEYIYENLTAKAEDSTMVEFDGMWLVNDFDGVYFMGAVGIKLAHMLGLGYVPMMLLGRFFNLLLLAACVYTAIKITPVGKNVFAVLGLLPITLHVANSFSRDTFVIALGFLFTAYVLYLINQKEVYRWWQLGILAVICLLLAPSKFIYITMCLAVFLLDIRKVPLLNRINWRIHPVIICAVAAAVMVPLLAKHMFESDPMFRWKIFQMGPLDEMLLYMPNQCISLEILVRNPGYALKLFANTIFTNGAYYIKSLVGGVLSYNSISISDAFIFVVLVVIVLSVICEPDETPLQTSHKVTFGGIFALLSAIIVFMCISWTFVTMETLYGLQGKYFLPALPMLLIALKNNTLAAKKDIWRVLCFAMAITNIFVALNAFVVIMQR